MRRTSVPLLLALAVAGGAVVWLLQIALVSAGQATLVPPGTLVLVLFGIAAILLALGWPIRQFVRGKRRLPRSGRPADRALRRASAPRRRARQQAAASVD